MTMALRSVMHVLSVVVRGIQVLSLQRRIMHIMAGLRGGIAGNSCGEVVTGGDVSGQEGTAGADNSPGKGTAGNVCCENSFADEYVKCEGGGVLQMILVVKRTLLMMMSVVRILHTAGDYLGCWEETKLWHRLSGHCRW